MSGLPGSRSQTHVHTFATEKLRRDSLSFSVPKHPPKQTRGPRLNDDDNECVRSLCANLKANDFREREGGIHTLVELSGDRPDLVGSNINGVSQLLGYSLNPPCHIVKTIYP